MIAQPVVCPVFVGRREELESLHDARRALAQSHGSVVLLGGEAGIGKSRLLAQFIGSIAGNSRPRHVAGVECIEHAEQPFGPFRTLLAALAKNTPAEHPAAALRALEQLTATADPAAGRLEKTELFAGVAAFLRSIASKRATIITIEDIHWADSSTLELLVYLASRVAGTRLLIVATYRSDELEARPELFASISRLSREPTVSRIMLEALDPEQTGELIAAALRGRAMLASEQRNDVIRRSEGNPFFAEELLKEALETPDRSRRSSLPISIRGMIADRLALLSPEHRRIVTHAAMLGYRFEPELLAMTLGCELDDVLPALRRGRDLNIFVQDEGLGARFRFRHALIRQAARGDLLNVEARKVHERILLTLEALPDSERHLDAMAYHAFEARDAEKTLRYSETAAAGALATSALPEARALYEQALAVAPDRASAARLLERVGTVSEAQGAISEASERYESALHAYRDLGDFDMAALMAGKAAICRNNLGDRSAVSFGTTFLAEHGEQVGASARDVLLASLARLATIHYENKRASELLAAVVAPSDLPPMPWQNYMTAKMDLLWFDGNMPAWSEIAERLFEAAGSLKPYNMLVTFFSIAQSAVWLGRRDITERALLRASRIPERTDFAALHVHGLSVQALHAYYFGSLEDARAHIREALRGSESVVSQMALATIVPLVAVELGDETLTTPAMLAEISDARRSAGNPDDASILAAGAAWSLAHGKHADARADLRRALAYLPHAMPSSGDLLFLAARHLELADVEPLRRLIGLENFLPNDVVGHANARLAGAVLEQRFGDEKHADEMASEAAVGYHELGWPLFEARALEIAGDSAKARALFVACGAAARVRPLAAHSQGAASPAAPGKLSERELAVARLIAAGSGNAAIGEQLSVSVKTVEKHIASIFEKLAVKNRAQIAAVVAREEHEGRARG